MLRRIRHRLLDDAEGLRSERFGDERIDSVLNLERDANTPLSLEPRSKLFHAGMKIERYIDSAPRPQLLDVRTQLALIGHDHALDVRDHLSRVRRLSVDEAVNCFQMQDNSRE